MKLEPLAVLPYGPHPHMSCEEARAIDVAEGRTNPEACPYDQGACHYRQGHGDPCLQQRDVHDKVNAAQRLRDAAPQLAALVTDYFKDCRCKSWTSDCQKCRAAKEALPELKAWLS